MWRLEIIDDWELFERQFSRKLIAARRPAYLFRGQGVSEWELEPSLVRRMRSRRWSVAETLREEVRVLDALPEQAGMSFDEFSKKFERGGVLEWWAALQHYGVPTRFLDWTRSPYVALFFAVEEKEHWNSPGAVWVLHPQTMQSCMQRRWGMSSPPKTPKNFYWNPDAPDQIFAGWPEQEVERSELQKGEFTWCRRVSSIHNAVISDLLPDDRPGSPATHEKWHIPGSSKGEFLARLSEMGITRETLFPGEDGSVSAARELARALARSDTVERYR